MCFMVESAKNEPLKVAGSKQCGQGWPHWEGNHYQALAGSEGVRCALTHRKQ